MTIHVCAGEGQPIHEYEEGDFRDKLFAGQLPPDGYYWHEGMADWKPIAEYRALAKTQRISFAPPMRRTVKIDMDPAPAKPAKSESAVGRFWRRLTGR